MENESNKNTNYNTKDNLSINLRNTQKSELDKEIENKSIKENNNISLSKKNNIENNKNQIQLKLIKILFGEKLKNKEETKINKYNENNNDNEEKEESEKIFYDSYSDFHRARIPKIKFRNNKDIQGIVVDNNKKKKEEIKEEIKNGDKNVEKEDEKINENLNINKEKKKIKKIVKKKVKKKKKKIKKDENNEPYETSVEKFDGEETSTQEEKLSHSVQERKVKNKKYFNYKENENEEQNDKQKEYKMKKKIEKEKEIIKEKEKEKEKQNIKEKKNENDKEIVKKEIEKKLAKKEIIKKLIKYSGKQLFDNKYKQNKKKAELNLSNLINKKEFNYNNNSREKNEAKLNEVESLIKREQIINSKLVNSNSLSYKERMRRKQLEKDLEAEINNDDLSDEAYDEDENEADLNNKKNNNEEFKAHSINKRKIIIGKDIMKKLNNSLTNRKKIFNLKSFKNLRQTDNKIYTPKKAIISRENSKRKAIGLYNKNRKMLNNNIFDTESNYKEMDTKTKCKAFNDNCINTKTIFPLQNNTLEFNHPSSIEISYIKSKKSLKDLQKNNLKHNKIVYIKKSPKREKEEPIEINYNYYNSNTITNQPINTGIYINSFNNDKFKKILTKRINRNINNQILINDQNVSFQSNEYTSQILNESNNDTNNTYRQKSNMLNINNNIQINTNNNNSFTFRKHIKISNPLQKSLPKIKLEDLVLIENKYFNIIHNLGEKKEIANDCFDLFNFYYNCSLYQSLLKFFDDQNVVKLNINYTLMSLLISYDLSFNKEKLKNIYLLLLEMFIVNYRNLMLIIEFITNKINKNSSNSIWINKLTDKIIKYKESQEGEEVDSYNNFGLTIIDKIKYNTHYLMQKIHYILLNYDDNNNNNNNNNLLFFLKTINANSYDKINIFFKENIIRENYDFCSLLASSLIKNNLLSNNKLQPKAPYITFPIKNKYSLVLDLDETLIYLDKIKDKNNGTLKIRPGTFSFLEKMKNYFEIIIFSEAEQNYVDLIINSLEENKKYFDYVFYRQHTTIQNEEFIKDLSKIGRKLSDIIIVDNMPQNFRLQPENGIYIKPFWGTDYEDDVLFSLSNILSKIANEGGDLRDGLKRYKNEIIINISFSYKDD